MDNFVSLSDLELFSICLHFSLFFLLLFFCCVLRSVFNCFVVYHSDNSNDTVSPSKALILTNDISACRLKGH